MRWWRPACSRPRPARGRWPRNWASSTCNAAYCPIFLPSPHRPTDLDVVQTGAWILPDERPLPAELKAFLDAGAPPVYVGFSSMRAPKDIARVAIEATRAQGRRPLVARGWADLALIDDRDDCFVVGEVNQQALFGRVADLGIGTAHDGPTPTTASLSHALRTALSLEQSLLDALDASVGGGATGTDVDVLDAELGHGVVELLGSVLGHALTFDAAGASAKPASSVRNPLVQMPSACCRSIIPHTSRIARPEQIASHSRTTSATLCWAKRPAECARWTRWSNWS
jgi:hypothetical protein